MTVRQHLFHLAGQYIFDRPGSTMTSAHHHEQLTRSGSAVVQAIAQARPTPTHQRLARHIIGIERWALVRLGGFRGVTPPHDEYNGYQPASHVTLPELADLFGAVRAEVAAVVLTLPSLDTAIPPVMHNDLGPLHVGGWLRYIDIHARIESKKLRK